MNRTTDLIKLSSNFISRTSVKKGILCVLFDATPILKVCLIPWMGSSLCKVPILVRLGIEIIGKMLCLASHA